MKADVQLKILLLMCLAITTGKGDNSTFKPTNEWQKIEEGQEIPAGLHLRINLQTGEKEAKLLDESGKDVKENGALTTMPENQNEAGSKETPKHKLKIRKTLTEASKTFSKDIVDMKYSPEKLDQIKHKYKTYNKLKESFEDMQKKFRTDMEIITLLFDEYKNLSKSGEHMLTSQAKITTQLRILEDFSYLVHQIDNALWFIEKGGLEYILLPLVVNETNMNVRVKAIRVLGALTLNNPKAQIKAFEKNFGSHLSQILISSTNTEELSTTLYAFGSLLRKFPLALQKILSTSGTQALLAVLAKECELKVKAKAMTLISDIIVEKKLVLSTYEDSNSALAAAQYAELNFPEWLQSSAYCETADAIVSTKLYEFLDQPDLAEYFVVALENSQDFCRFIWAKSPQLRHTLFTLKNRYMDSQDEYRLEVAQQIETLIEILYHTKVHVEL